MPVSVLIILIVKEIVFADSALLYSVMFYTDCLPALQQKLFQWINELSGKKLIGHNLNVMQFT